MSIFSKIFQRQQEQASTTSADDFMSLTQVYFQAALASNLGITNIRLVPELAQFKRLFKVPTAGGKLGIGEKAASKRMLMADYGLSENYFKEIDSSLKKHCKSQQQLQSYMFMYQGFISDLMMLTGNLMQWKLRLPSYFKSTLQQWTADTVHQICTKPVWKKDDEQKAANSIRNYKERLDYSESWMTEFVFTAFMLAKKQKRAEQQTEKK